MKETRIRITGGGLRGVLFSIGLTIVGIILVLAVLKGVLGINLAFFRTTLSLKPTTLKLEDIQDLEFLVTSEYFGELVGTARDYFVRRVMPRAEALAVRLSGSANPSEEKLSDEETDILNAIRGALIKRSGQNPRVIDRINDLKDVAKFLTLELRDGRFLPTFSDLVLGQFLAKRDIAFLARGSVQAGYDLKDISADKYFYCPSTKTLSLNCRVQIFSRQINPWFIYDSKAGFTVKGFEIISQTNVDLEDEGVYDFLKNIKEECQRRLEDDARREGIEAQARESAEHTLENMLKMLKSDVQTVRILPADTFELQKNACPESRKSILSSR
jgi:hypothetical protein